MKKSVAVGIVLGIFGRGSCQEPSRPLSSGIEDEAGQFPDSYRLALESRDAPRLRTL